MTRSDLVKRFSDRTDYHQLRSYGKVMHEIGWQVADAGGSQIFIKKIGPISFAKFQRPNAVDFAKLEDLRKKFRILALHVEPGLSLGLSGFFGRGFKEVTTHFAYTKTLIVDLNANEKEILSRFSKTTAYQMRRSLTRNVTYEAVPFRKLTGQQKQEILRLHSQWSREKKVAGYDDAFLMAFWKHMREGTMVLARIDGALHGALFLLVHHKVAMYFYQFSSAQARSGLFIPSGLAYQAIKLAVAEGCDIFDLCSAYDERFPEENIKWKGFTHYKERFHPVSVYYPPALRSLHLPI